MIRKTSIITLSFVLDITQTVFSGPVISKSQKNTDFICQSAFLRNIGRLLLDHDEFMLQEKKACVEREQQRGLLNSLLLYLEIKEDAQKEALNDWVSFLTQKEKPLKTVCTQEKWRHFYIEYETLIPRHEQPMHWFLYKNNNEKKGLLEERKKDFRKIGKIGAQHKASICNPFLKRAYISEDNKEHMSEE